MDEYHKSALKSAQALRKERERQTKTQMQDLFAIQDEATLISALKNDFDITPSDPRYDKIMQIWSDEQQRLRRGY